MYFAFQFLTSISLEPHKLSSGIWSHKTFIRTSNNIYRQSIQNALLEKNISASVNKTKQNKKKICILHEIEMVIQEVVDSLTKQSSLLQNLTGYEYRQWWVLLKYGF